MEKKVITFGLIAVLIALLGGYGLGYSIYQPQNQSFQETLDNVNEKLDAINSTLATTRSSVASLQNQLNLLNSSYHELKTLLNQTRPEFSIVDLRLTDENFFPPQYRDRIEMPSATAYITLQNTGTADATQVDIKCEDLFINHTGSLRFYGETRLSVLNSHDIVSTRISFKWEGVGGGNPIGINVSITCAEGANLSFVYSYAYGVAYSIQITNTRYTQIPYYWGYPLNYTEYRNATEITIKNTGNLTFSFIKAYGFLENGSLGSNKGFDPNNPTGPQPSMWEGGAVGPGASATIRMWDYPTPEEKLAYILIFLPSYTWIHIAVDTRNI